MSKFWNTMKPNYNESKQQCVCMTKKTANSGHRLVLNSKKAGHVTNSMYGSSRDM